MADKVTMTFIIYSCWTRQKIWRKILRNTSLALILILKLFPKVFNSFRFLNRGNFKLSEISQQIHFAIQKMKKNVAWLSAVVFHNQMKIDPYLDMNCSSDDELLFSFCDFLSLTLIVCTNCSELLITKTFPLFRITI